MSGKVALVTGGSRGIGRAIVESLAKSGCNVIVNFVKNESAALETCDHVTSNYQGVRLVPFKADCSNPDEVQNMFKFIKTEFGQIDILVNNAGILKDAIVPRLKKDDFESVINVNINSTFYCSQAAFGMMLAKKQGRVINISSIVGQIGNIGQSNYAAAKAGVIGLTKSMAREFATRNITVNAVCPGYIETEMTKGIDTEKILPTIPLRRLGSPSEVAGLVHYLALDPSASYITGHCFNIDGGVAIGAN